MKTIVCGDTHGDWSSLNRLINRQSPEVILHCGDFGWWPKFDNSYLTGPPKIWRQDGIKNPFTEIHFCPGNHEDWESLLREHSDRIPKEVLPRIFYHRRGSVMELPDKRKVLFVGGARSIDAKFRIQGRDWFVEEEMGYREFEEIMDIDQRIDIVISHAAPNEFLDKLYDLQDKFLDSTTIALSRILEKFKPKLWYFGHYHQYKTGHFKRTHWFALNMSPNDGWWTRLL